MSNSGLSPAGPIGGRDPPTDKTCQVSMSGEKPLKAV